MKKLCFLTLALAAAFANNARAAGFTPIAINPASFNHDVVVEAAAPKTLSDALTATVDGGTNKAGNTWYEIGYNPAAPTTGVPLAGSTITSNNHSFLMPPNYHVANAVAVGHNNGGRTPLMAGGTLTLTTPAPFTGLSILTAAGNAGSGTPLSVGYTIHYANATTESGTFGSRDWFDNTVPYVYNPAGRVSAGGGVANVGGNPGAALFAADIPVSTPGVNVTSIDFTFVGAGANGNTNNNGRAFIFAVSGAKDSSTDYTNTLAVTGFNLDAVVEADGPQTTGTGSAAGTTLTNNVTATMDGGTSRTNSAWYEKGYYSAFPNSGLPAPGGTLTSATLPASYTMPASYTANNAVLLASNVTSATITLAAPTSVGALSFLGACANGDTFIPYVITFGDSSTQTGALFVPDWSNRVLPPSYIAFGRVAAHSRTINNTPEQFVNPFALTPLGVGVAPYFDYRGLGLPIARLFDVVINVSNASPVASIALSFTNGISTRVAAILAVSGAAVGSVPPVFGATGTATPGQPANAALNGVTLVKRWEGTNNVVLSVTNIAGSGPIAYQWKKAPRGGGLRDIFYSFDYSTFANVVDGGRVSGATTSALVISNALVADSSDYLVVASTAGGAVTSTVATVMILTTNQSLLVGVPFGDTLTPIAADSTPVAESIDHVIDQVAQKWLSDGLQWGGACCGGLTPFVGPVGYVTVPVSGSSIPTAMRFFTANDSNGRDPSDYTLEGSNDGATWTRITGGVLKGTLSLPTGRNGTGSTPVDALNQNVIEVNFANSTGYKNFRVTITNNMNQLADPLMQIAEIQLLGTLVPNPPVWVRQPEPTATVYVGGSPTFGVQASGYPAPKYQWFRGASSIAGATGTAYTLPNAQLADSGATFRCVASNNFASITSSIATLTVIAAPTQPYPVSVLSDNPIGYWRLNESDDSAGNNGAITHDYRGGHNGYYSNSVNFLAGYNPVSDPDTCAGFGSLLAANCYVADIKDISFVRATNAVSGGTFSVEAWVYAGNQTLPAAIVSKGYNGILNAGTGTGTEQFVLDVTGSPSAFRFLVRDSAGNGTVAQSTKLPVDGNGNPTWRHLVGVCDQPNAKMYLYVDGLLAASASIATNVGILDQPLPMTIGSRKSGGATEFDNQWAGRIDDVAIYNTALSSARVLNHYYGAQLPPVITLQPTNQTVPNNVSVTFNSAAYGPGTLTYQWYLSDGVNPTAPVGGQTTQNLTLTTTPAMSGNNYQLVVSNPYGSTTGAVAQLTVVSGPPQFATDLPASSSFGVGHVVQLRVAVLGTAPFTYQWQKNGVNVTDNYRISGSHSAVLTIICAATNDTGNYQVLVTGTTTVGSTIDAVTVAVSTSSAPPFTAAGTGWTMQGSSPPIMSANRLELTSNLGNTARSAWITAQQLISTFNASFVYQDVTGVGGADGVTFCVQNQGPTALGGGGGGLGYSGITPSVALAFNIYDPNTRGIAFLQNGAVTPPFAPATPVLVGGNANPIQVNISYSGGVATATFQDLVTLATYTTNRTVDIPTVVGSTSAYIGFTGADGGVASTQVISNFTMSPPAVPLRYQQSGNSLIFSWPANVGACLQSTPSITPPSVWTDSTDPAVVVGTDVQTTVTPLTGNKFYRLKIFP